MNKKKCSNCEGEIDTTSDHYVLLGTYKQNKTLDETYFHILCWRRYFEECARKKAQVVVDGMQERMMPIARQLTDKLKTAIDQANG